MPVRPIFHKDFGAHLRQLRKALGWTQSDAARHAKQKGLPITRQILLHLEAGRTKEPAPDVLRAVARLYEQRYEDVVGDFVTEHFGVRLVTSPVTGGSDNASARIGGIPDETTVGGGTSLSDTQISDILAAVIRARIELDAIEDAVGGGVVSDIVPPSTHAPDSDADTGATRRVRNQK